MISQRPGEQPADRPGYDISSARVDDQPGIHGPHPPGHSWAGYYLGLIAGDIQKGDSPTFMRQLGPFPFDTLRSLWLAMGVGPGAWLGLGPRYPHLCLCEAT